MTGELQQQIIIQEDKSKPNSSSKGRKNSIRKVNKAPVIEIHAEMTKEEMMKDLLFELMGNQDFDVYLEYANQKEAI